MLLIAFVMLATAEAESPPPNEPLSLVCLGRGSANKQRTASVYASNSYGESGWAQATSQRSEPFEDQADVRLFSGDDRIRLPRKLLPPIHGGDGGWFKLKNIKVSDREITAKAAINFINSPNVRIDRFNGSITISGKAGEYFGECEAFDANAQTQKF